MATTIFSESFETDGNPTRYTTSVDEFTDGSGDFFTRTDGSNIGSFYEVTGATGSFFFAGMDLDGEKAGLPLTLSFEDIDVSGASDLQFAVDVAEDDDGTGEDWDVSDFVRIDYAIDGDEFETLLAFESIPDGDPFNAVPALDTDFDTNGDSPTLTDTFATFQAAIDGTGAQLDLRFTFQLNSGDEDIAIDNIVVSDGASNGGTTAPAAVINELRVDQNSSDLNEFFELTGVPGTSLDTLTYIVIGDGTGGSGVIEAVVPLTGQSIPVDGFFLTVENANNFEGEDLVANLNFENGDNVTHLLVEGFAGSNGDDLDTDDDGALDSAPWAAIVDSVALLESVGSGDQVYSATEVGPNGSFAPAGVARDPNGTGAFQILDFFDQSADTPGTENFPEVSAPLVSIMDIQGAGHVSPFVLGNQTTADFFANLPGDTFNITGGPVTTSGVVTALDDRGFYLQDPDGDGDAATSDAIFVFTSSAPGVGVGDLVEVQATVSEFFPGDTDTRNLPSTQLTNPTVTTLDTGTVAPTVLANIPDTVIDDDAFGAFQPTLDGIDFFEAIEAMLVTAPDVLATSGTNRFGEIFGVINQGADASGISSRGTLNISPDDFNPEKIQIDSSILLPSIPEVDTGALLGDVTGVVGYSFGNFEILPTVDFTPNITPSTLTQDSTALAGDADTLTVASYNVLNLDPIIEDVALVDDQDPGDVDDDEGDGRFAAIAEQIVGNLGAPDIIGLQEIQNNTGAQIDDVSAADITLQKLADAIEAAGGPVYSFIDTPNAPADRLDADGDPVRPVGGQPGGTIRNAFLYNADRVDLVADSVVGLTDGNETDANGPFFGGRIPLAATFEFNGEEVTLVNAHLSSKGGSAPILGIEQPFDQRQEEPDVNGSLDERQVQAQAINNFVDGIFANNANANVVALGDFNEFEFVSPLAIVAGEEVAPIQVAGPGGLEAVEKVLTNLTETLPEDERYTFNFQGNSQSLDHVLVSDSLLAGAEFDIVNTNSEFAATESRASDHDPLVVGLDLTEEPDVYTLEILHAADQEAGEDALVSAPNFSAVLAALEAQDLGDDGEADNTVKLSSGDAIIPGLFFEASAAAFGGAGRADILIQNELGFQAITLGNHEFDLGTEFLAGLIASDTDYDGALFPYLSTNLDFSTDADLDPLEVAGGQAPQANTVTSSVVLDVNGESVGVIGATTPNLASISSPGGVTILPSEFPGQTFSDAELQALAAEIQAEVDLLTNDPDNPTNKIILQTHFQSLDNERGIIQYLSDVDVVIGGGSNSLLVDENDPLHDDDDADDVDGEYPEFLTDADGNPVALVNTDGNYKYVGRLVLDFDENGHVIPASYDTAVSGAYATDAAGVAALDAEGLIDPEIQDIVDALEVEIDALKETVIGFTDVDLDGNRASVRTEETNMGNLTADANLVEAQKTDPDVLVSLKNGGGIRAPIDAGEITIADHLDVLRFNNDLVLVTLTGAQLAQVLEHAVAATGPDETPGQFAQVAGVNFSFDPDAAPGERVENAVVLDGDGNPLVELVVNGEVVAPEAEVRVVTLGFLAGGGDGYPYPEFEAADPAFFNKVALEDPQGIRTGEATFANDGTEQDALAEYLIDNHGTEAAAFNEAETEPALDVRIQNLNERNDDVFDFNGFVADDSRVQRFELTDGADKLFVGAALEDGGRQRFLVEGFEAGVDQVDFTAEDILFSREAGPNLLVYIDNDDRDSFVFRGVDSVEDLFTDLPIA